MKSLAKPMKHLSTWLQSLFAEEKLELFTDKHLMFGREFPLSSQGTLPAEHVNYSVVLTDKNKSGT
ncbi:hypothetical protein FBQ80_13470 [Candidatus Brocadia sp. AMX2]|nr:MAG: hypothetical protein EDM70_12095 [Candidatus Brocadia sp. AMX2]MDL1936566.1 hypothetical protein [Candidatus Brocadia sp. AMX2]